MKPPNTKEIQKSEREYDLSALFCQKMLENHLMILYFCCTNIAKLLIAKVSCKINFLYNGLI